MTDDDGTTLLDSIVGLPGVLIDRPSSKLVSIPRGRSMLPMQTVLSPRDSLTPHLNTNGVTMPLATLCDLIAQCASLERAQILSVECYKEWSKYGVLHRFLVFHLRRPGRSDVWLRLDRKAITGVSIQKLIRSRGRTEANDVVRRIRLLN